MAIYREEFRKETEALEKIIKKNKPKDGKLDNQKIISEINKEIKAWGKSKGLYKKCNLVTASFLYLDHAWVNKDKDGIKVLDEVFFEEFIKDDNTSIRKLASEFTLCFMALYDLSIYDREKNLLKRINEDNIIGNTSSPKNELLDCIYKYSRHDISLLIIGQTGTSKGLLSKAIHKMSKRRKKNYIEVNCAAIPKDLLESELFGHERGAFTGAESQKKGKIELADKGTLLLDELGKMPINLQAKLLKAVEDNEVWRVGGVKSIKINVRFLATLQPGEIEHINEDLLYRFSWPIHLKMPSLKERLEVLGNTIIENSLERVLEKIELEDVSLSPSTYKKLINKEDYPGNYRELENILLDAVLSAKIEERKEVLPKDISFGSTFNNEALSQVENIKLKDIVEYADKEASALCVSIIQKKLDGITDIKNTLKLEGLTEAGYRNHVKKMRDRFKKRGKLNN